MAQRRSLEETWQSVGKLIHAIALSECQNDIAKPDME